MWYSNIKASRELIWEYVDPEKLKDKLPLLIKLVKPILSKYKDRLHRATKGKGSQYRRMRALLNR